MGPTMGRTGLPSKGRRESGRSESRRCMSILTIGYAVGDISWLFLKSGEKLNETQVLALSRKVLRPPAASWCDVSRVRAASGRAPRGQREGGLERLWGWFSWLVVWVRVKAQPCALSLSLSLS